MTQEGESRIADGWVWHRSPPMTTRVVNVYLGYTCSQQTSERRNPFGLHACFKRVAPMVDYLCATQELEF
jgi:hypothetical protein